MTRTNNGQRWRDDAGGWQVVAAQGEYLGNADLHDRITGRKTGAVSFGIDHFIAEETVTDATRAHERRYASNHLAPTAPVKSWRAVVRQRIHHAHRGTTHESHSYPFTVY